jgi:integrase
VAKAKAEFVRFSDRSIAALKPRDKVFEVRDVEVSDLRIRVRPSGARSYLIVARVAGGGPSVCITIGKVGVVLLEDARREAARLRSEMALGSRPRSRRQIAEEREAVVAAERKAAVPIEQRVAIYCEERRTGKLKAWRNLDARERDLLRTIKPWHGRPATEITYDDVRALVGGFTAKGQHRSAVSAVRDLQGLFAWLAHERRIPVSPFAGMKSSYLLGGAADLKPRERVLSDDELRIVWDAAGKLDAPYGVIVRLLILLGLRRQEVAALRWGEIDLANHRLTLPASRTKTKSVHTVPLVGLAFELMRSIQRPKLAEAGDCVFHTRQGFPITGFDHGKRPLDALIAAAGHKVEPWVIHDLRRSMRSGLSRLVDKHGDPLISFDVREHMVGHRVGNAISRTYDKTLPWQAMVRAAELWSAHVATVIGENVVKLPKPTKRGTVEA